MEQSTLHTMIHERDAQISSLLHQLHSISDNISALQKELHHRSQARKHQREEHSAAIKKLKEEHAEQRAHLARYESKIKGGGGLRVHEYAALMKAANKDVESSYVIRLQAQLCRAMHSLGVMESQLALVKENCSSLIKSMKEDLSHMVDDRTRREIELMNTLAMVDAEKRSWQAEMEKKLREQEDLLDSVRDEYEELGLEYDEEEVRRALEAQMLQEQVERVKKEKVLAEKDLLAALLEREEQIGKLKGEMDGLKGSLKELKGESGETNEDSEKKADTDDAECNDVSSPAAADISNGVNDGATEDESEPNIVEPEEEAATNERKDEESPQETQNQVPAVNSGDQTPLEPQENNMNEEEVDENVSDLSSQLENTTIDEPDKPVDSPKVDKQEADENNDSEKEVANESTDDATNVVNEATENSEPVEPANDDETKQIMKGDLEDTPEESVNSSQEADSAQATEDVSEQDKQMDVDDTDIADETPTAEEESSNDAEATSDNDNTSEAKE